MAVFLSQVVDAAKARGLDVTGQTVAQCVYRLVDEGRLAAEGNVRRWRAAQVRRADA
jgi:hypothetical protein